VRPGQRGLGVQTVNQSLHLAHSGSADARGEAPRQPS
jgi:hypothetical protein